MTEPEVHEEPEILLVSCDSWEELELSAAKATGDGYIAIISAAGMLAVKSKHAAVGAFGAMLHTYQSHVGEDATLVSSVKDPSGNTAIGFGVNTEKGVYMYGLTDEEYMQLAKDFMRKN